MQAQTASTKSASLPPLPAVCICSLWSTPGQLKVNDHIGKHYKWPTTSNLYQKLFQCGVYFLNSEKAAIKFCSSWLVYSSWFLENMGFLFWRSIQTTQNIIGFGLTDLPHKELKQTINKEIMTEKAISCSSQTWCTNKYSKAKILQIRDFNLIHGWAWLLMHDPIHRTWKWKKKISRSFLLCALKERTPPPIPPLEDREAEKGRNSWENEGDKHIRHEGKSQGCRQLRLLSASLQLSPHPRPWHTVVASTLCVGH